MNRRSLLASILLAGAATPGSFAQETNNTVEGNKEVDVHGAKALTGVWKINGTTVTLAQAQDGSFTWQLSNGAPTALPANCFISDMIRGTNQSKLFGLICQFDQEKGLSFRGFLTVKTAEPPPGFKKTQGAYAHLDYSPHIYHWGAKWPARLISFDDAAMVLKYQPGLKEAKTYPAKDDSDVAEVNLERLTYKSK